MERCDWDDLPEAVRREVGKHCGPIGKVRPVAAGMNNAAAGVIELDSGGGALFYKGIRTDDPRAWMYRNEIAAAEAGAPGPALRCVIEAGDWIVLGWEHIEGRHADLNPGSSDLDLIACALRELAERPPLDHETAFADQSRRWEQMHPWTHLATEPPSSLDPWVRTNLEQFAEREDAAFDALAGDHLAHTDVHEFNILIDTKQASLVDWAWARRAAPWVDAEMFTLRLVAAGHPCEDADRWRLANLPYSDLELDVRQAFACEMLGAWLWLVTVKAGRPLFRQMYSHALHWVKHLHQLE